MTPPVEQVVYLSPEQLNDQSVDHRSDLYALATIAYEALCGRTPFVSSSFGQMIAYKLTDPPPSPTQFRRDLPVTLERVLLQWLDPHPSQRFPTALAFGVALAEEAFAEEASAEEAAPFPLYPCLSIALPPRDDPDWPTTGESSDEQASRLARWPWP
jgi:serine/threonine protein kinase